MEEYFAKNGLSGHLAVICGFRPGFEKGKDHFDFIMNQLKVSTKELLFCGDSLKDKERAAINHVPFVGRLGLFRREEFCADGPCETMTDLTYLKRIL
jgi:phosphoglycolate phosphatase-like HAD superfamily hydrolase